MTLTDEPETARRPRGCRADEPERSAAFRKLFVTYYGPMRRYACRLLRDGLQADDVVQDVFVRLWERWHTWDADLEPGPYLYRAVKHRAFDIAKHSRVVVRHLEVAPRADHNSASGVAGPEQDLYHTELRAAVDAAVDALPGPQHDVFVLSRHGGLTYAEIAKTLGVSIKTVEKRMSVTFRALYIALGPYR